MGELRYVEIVVLGLLLLNLHKAVRCLGRWEQRFVILFLLAASAQIVSDLINDASIDGTLKRAGTYVILALLVIAIKWLSRGDPARLRLILAGYCISYVFILLVGQSASKNYGLQPWRLGLGTSATIFLCLLSTILHAFNGLAGPPLSEWPSCI
ncbi:MAG: hypothetical protein IPM60_05710 [Rhodospirillales bacterium]|nr:hypothetical protein [Rhodospirillales bacterium]